MKVYAFDFDGTLTDKDSFICFLFHTKGKLRTYLGLLLFSPLLVLMKLHLYDNGKTKQKVFSYFFKGTSEEEFNNICEDFATNFMMIMRWSGTEKVVRALNAGHKVFIVTSSLDSYVTPFFIEFPGSEVIGTKVEFKDGIVTGRFASPNCYGREKVNRLNDVLGDRSAYTLIAYGDSRGDKEMLEYADKAYYKTIK
jgi:phosphatidylglycerophosphatase C